MARTYRTSPGTRMINSVFQAMIRLGLGKEYRHILTVRGRRTGKPYSTPVDIMQRDGQRWLVAAYGVTNWVRNARAAGRVTLSRGRRSKTLRVAELDPEVSVPVLRQYLREVPVTQPYFDATPDSPDQQIAAEAPRHPVFVLLPPDDGEPQENSMPTAEKTRRGMALRSIGPFFALTFGLTWGIAALLILFLDQIEAIFGELSYTHPLFILAVYSPGFAGVFLIWRHYGVTGLGSYLRRLTLWRMPAVWWIFLVIGIPALFYLAAAIAGTITDPFPFSPWYDLLPALAVALFIGPIEELGWRGVALPLLQRRFAPLCRFCGATGRLTKEHVWPRWLANYMPNLERPGYAERWSSGSRRERWRAPFLSATVRAVCAQCNNGWMAAIEAAAKPHVGPMVMGQTIELDADAQAIVANWVAVKGLIAALTSKDAQPIPDYHLHRVAAAGGAPANTVRMWIGHRRDLAGRTRQGHVTLLDSHFMPVTNVFPQFPTHPEIERYRAEGGVFNALVFQAGHFFALAFQHDWPGLLARPRPRTKASHALLPVWPTGLDVRWPPPRSVDELGDPHKITQFMEIAPVVPPVGP